MKPPPFDYHAPDTLEEAVGLLVELADEDVKCLAGGQSLVPLLNLRLARPGALVDINGISGLRGIDRTNGAWRIGALTRHADIEDSADLRARMPLLPAVAGHIGYRAIRNRGTLGGAIAHADPVAEWPAIVRVLDARLEVVGPSGERVIDAEHFFVSVFTPALEPEEILRAMVFDAPPAPWSWGFSEFARKVGDYAIVSAAAVAELDGNRVTRARIALSGVASTPVRVPAAEEAVVGQSLADAAALDRIAGTAAEEIDPPSDLHGTAGYRRQLARSQVRQALQAAGRREET